MKKSLLILILTLLFCATSFAQTASETLTNLLLNIHTMQADFTQTIQDKDAKSIQRSQGRMALERPGKFRWEVLSPVKQLIIANKSRLWIYDPDLEQVVVRSFHRAAGQTPALLLSDTNLALGKDFNVTLMHNPSQIAGTQLFLLTPKNTNDPLEKIILTFHGKQIYQMQLADRLDHVTIITFRQVKQGIAFSAGTFVFKPPPQVDVIDETNNKT